MVIDINKQIKNILAAQDYIQETMDGMFSQINIKPMMFICVGAILSLVGFFKIIGSSIEVAVWVAIMIAGVSAFKFGMEKGGYKMPSKLTAKFHKVAEFGNAGS
ncbi:MAG: hypothetical protein HQL52_05770 [Magnetococcales bacterium]|nr:hypothetical protein [Magnetococcales bacterium]